MDRRKFAKYVVSGAFVGIAGGGYYWLNKQRDHDHLALDTMLNKLEELQRGVLKSNATWEIPRTFHHLAQSVEFSMAGFPEMRSPVFTNTVGALAFKVFNAKGKMSHPLDAPIPGEIVDEEANDTRLAIERLTTALTDFRAYEADLKPHFAYGALDKDAYAIAHALHVNNHLEEFELV